MNEPCLLSSESNMTSLIGCRSLDILTALHTDSHAPKHHLLGKSLNGPWDPFPLEMGVFGKA